jgi:hypothetical protein
MEKLSNASRQFISRCWWSVAYVGGTEWHALGWVVANYLLITIL